MVTSSERRVRPEDYFLIKACTYKCLSELKDRRVQKLWFKHIDPEAIIKHIMATDCAYIVDDTYLVVYAINEPWYATDGVTFLQELLVFNLLGNRGRFRVVPAFLERKAKEAGAVLVGVGTALTQTDAALASVYSRYGYQIETHILVKEPAVE